MKFKRKEKKNCLIRTIYMGIINRYRTYMVGYDIAYIPYSEQYIRPLHNASSLLSIVFFHTVLPPVSLLYNTQAHTLEDIYFYYEPLYSWVNRFLVTYLESISRSRSSPPSHSLSSHPLTFNFIQLIYINYNKEKNYSFIYIYTWKRQHYSVSSHFVPVCAFQLLLKWMKKKNQVIVMNERKQLKGAENFVPDAAVKSRLYRFNVFEKGNEEERAKARRLALSFSFTIWEV